MMGRQNVAQHIDHQILESGMGPTITMEFSVVALAET